MSPAQNRSYGSCRVMSGHFGFQPGRRSGQRVSRRGHPAAFSCPAGGRRSGKTNEDPGKDSEKRKLPRDGSREVPEMPGEVSGDSGEVSPGASREIPGEAARSFPARTAGCPGGMSGRNAPRPGGIRKARYSPRGKQVPATRWRLLRREFPRRDGRTSSWARRRAQCFTSGGMCTTSPGCSSRGVSPHA